MQVYMAAYGHIYIYIYLYIHYFDAQEVHKTYSQYIHTQAAGARYTKLTQLQFSTT